MARTAKDEQLSLRDMVLRWCDPVLVKAVQAVEASFTESQVCAACTCSLGGAAPGFPDPGDLDPDAIARIRPAFESTWNGLDRDLRSRIMISRIRLSGIHMQASAGSPRQDIPPSYVDQYAFDFAASSVHWFRGGGWRIVKASLTTEAFDIRKVGGQPLPLLKAMLTWCDDTLVDRCETAEMAARLAAEIRTGRLRLEQQRRYAGVSKCDIERLEQPWKAQLKPARAELLADFLARLASGAIQLIGLQVEPVLAVERRALSTAWVNRMQFNWQQQTVRVERTLFVDVVGTARVMSPQPEAKTDAALGTRKSRRGRPSFPMAEMVAIARDDPKLGLGPKKRRATFLLNEFARLNPSSTQPAYRTIYDHATEIYTTAAANAGPLKTPK